jgi:general secretion pathway protein N
MFRSFELTRLALLSSLILGVGFAPSARAASSATVDILPDDVVGAPLDRVDVGKVKPLTGQKSETGKPSPSGNPLWSVPLSVLTATQERPIFSASRRPPPRAVTGPRIDPVPVPIAKPTEPEHPTLALIGAVVGDNTSIAVFLDRTNQGIVRLRAGEAHEGWTLNSVLPREVILKKADQVEVLVLQRPNGSPGAAPSLELPAQAASGTDAPFIPRSTPKSGEADGL